MSDAPDADEPSDLAPDLGAAQERTDLAWRRTGLALLVGVLTIGRHSMGTLGPFVTLPILLGSVLAGWIVVKSLRASRLPSGRSQDTGFLVLTDGQVPAAAGIIVAMLSIGEIANAILAALH